MLPALKVDVRSWNVKSGTRGGAVLADVAIAAPPAGLLRGTAGEGEGEGEASGGEVAGEVGKERGTGESEKE